MSDSKPNGPFTTADLRDGKTAIVECPVCGAVTGYHHGADLENCCANCNAPLEITNRVLAVTAVRAAKTTWSPARIADMCFRAELQALSVNMMPIENPNVEQTVDYEQRLCGQVATAMRAAATRIKSTAVEGLTVEMMRYTKATRVYARRNDVLVWATLAEASGHADLPPDARIVIVRDEGGRYYVPGCVGMLLAGHRAASGEA